MSDDSKRQLSYEELSRMGDGRTISEVLDELEARYGDELLIPIRRHT